MPLYGVNVRVYKAAAARPFIVEQNGELKKQTSNHAQKPVYLSRKVIHNASISLEFG